MDYMYQAQDGLGPWIKEYPPRCMRPHRQEKYPSISLNVSNKTSKLVARGYIIEGVILTLTSLFSVTKVTEDICMVFDATVSGLNNYLSETHFMLPSMRSLLMMVGPETHMVDLDVEEIFYNFQLSSVMEKYCGVDFGSYLGYKKDRKVKTLWMRWICLMMGLVLSPYANIQGLLWESQLGRGDRNEPDNPFRWNKIRLNLPGDPNYPPKIIWMSKI